MADLLVHFSLNFPEAIGNYKGDDFPTAKEIGALKHLHLKLDFPDSIEVYEYDTSDSGSNKILNELKKNGALKTIFFEYPVLVNDSFVIMGYNNCPDDIRKKIINTFKEFK